MPRLVRGRIAAAAVMIAMTASIPSWGQTTPATTFADLTDLTLGAPVILHATIQKAEKLNRKEAPDVQPGVARMLIEAQVQNVLVSPEVVPARIQYLWDTPLDARGKAPKPKGANVTLFLRRVAGREGQYQLASPNGQIARSENNDAAIRRVLSDSRKPELRDLRITGIGHAFHVRGSIPGESESQIFLTTASGRPVSLVVLGRPNMPKSFSVALSDVIDDAAQSVPRDTLMWYKLACALPQTLPSAAVADLGEEDARAVAADYGFVLTTLGRCERTLR